MTTPTIVKYPFDPTATAPSNLIVDEQYLVPATRNRAFALNGGPFYAESVVVKSLPTNSVLTKGTDYKVLYLYQDATIKTNKAVNAVVHIVNPTIVGTVAVTYQVVGGTYSTNYDAIQLLLEQLAVDNRNVRFSDLIDAPVTYPPKPHLHSVGDMYGWDSVIQVLEDIRDASLGGGTSATGILGLKNIVVGTSTNLQRNRNYLTTAANAIHTLPDTILLDIGDTIVVDRAFSSVVSYTTNNPTTESIQYRDQVVDVLGHTGTGTLKFIYRGGFVWECIG